MSIDIQEKAGLHGSLASDAFRLRYKELLASFDPEQVGRSLVGFIRLHLRDEIAGIEPDLNVYLAHTESAFLTLFDSGKLQPVAPLTPLGESALADMRRRAGVNPPGYVAPAPAPRQLTAQEELDIQVAEDFQKLSAKEFRSRCSNGKKYRETFFRLGEEGRLSITA